MVRVALCGTGHCCAAPHQHSGVAGAAGVARPGIQGPVQCLPRLVHVDDWWGGVRPLTVVNKLGSVPVGGEEAAHSDTD